MNRHVLQLAVPIAVLALAACGGSSSKSSASDQSTVPPPAATSAATDAPTTAFTPTTLPNACELVPKPQAEAAIGNTLEDGNHIANPGQDSCQYPGDPNGPLAQVEVYIGTGAKNYYDDDNNVLHHQFTSVPGLGDESHEEDYAIFFRKGTTWVAIRLTTLDDASTLRPKIEDLARQVAAKL